MLPLSLVMLLCHPSAAHADPCPADDFRTRVTGSNECIVIATYAGNASNAATSGGGPGSTTAGTPVAASPAASTDKPRTLLVWLHGDTSNGGPAMSHVPEAKDAATRFADARVLSIAMWRPGYGDDEGHVSGGDNHGRSDHYTAANMAIMGDAISRLKSHYAPERTIVIGHSGGAATTANLLGMKPGLIDAAVLISCPCDLRAWRAGRRWWGRSEDPAAWADKVSPSTRVIALTGLVDDNTSPSLAEQYVKKLSTRGIDARFVGIPEAGHNAALRAPEVMTAVGSLLP